MTKRLNPFEVPEINPAAVQPPSIYDDLRVAEHRKRNRQWEKQHQSHKAVYRGINLKLSLQVKSIAGDLLVPAGEVARAVIEYALRAHAQGDLDLHPRPNPDRMRMTLFPTSHSAQRPNKQMKSSKRKQTESTWKVITTWRSFPPELKRELAELASEDGLNVPIGELISALLRFGLKAHERCLLTLEPMQKRTTNTLAPEGTQ